MSDSQGDQPASISNAPLQSETSVKSEVSVQQQQQPTSPALPEPREVASSAGPTTSQTPAGPSTQDRHELLNKARSFLSSPQIVHQNVQAKRTFLREKGLGDAEIEKLMSELPSQPPVIPPRSYPQPPPSNLPGLLLGVIRLFSWLAGGSAALIFIYYRYLLPRISQTSQARLGLKSHQASLLRRLTNSLATLKESQAESFVDLPRPQPYKESPKFAPCKSVGGVLKLIGEGEPPLASIPPVTLLRCAIADLAKGKEEEEKRPTTEDIFRYLEGRIPSLIEEGGLEFEEKLWETLNSCPYFTRIEPQQPSTSPEGEPLQPTRWEYTAPEPIPPPPVVKSLDGLVSTMPKDVKERKSPFQHTLQSLSDFTGYISTQVYLPYRPSSTGMGIPNNNTSGTAEEEFKKEIRALKGLVLNRRSFMPTIPRASSNLSTHRVAS